MLKLKKWRRVTHEETGISCEVGRLRYDQGPLLAAMTADVFATLGELRDEDGKPKPGISVAQTTAAVREAFARMDSELIADLFESKVRNVEGLETEDGPVSTGTDLLDLANQSVLLWILGELVAGSQLTDQEGKDSPSPSTSSSEGTADSASPAESTESGDGASPLTATGESKSASSSQVA